MKIGLLSIFIIILMGTCRPQEPDPKAAIFFKKASETLKQNPTNPDSLMSALNILDSAIHLDSNNVRYLFTKSKISITLKKYDLAINSCNEILAKHKDDYLTTLTKGVVFELSNRIDSAKQTYRRALNLLNKTKFEKTMYKEHERIILFGLLRDTSKFNTSLNLFKDQFKSENDFIHYYQELKGFNRVDYINS